MNINGIDYHYYNETRDIFRPQYDWENLILTVGACEENLNLNIKIDARTDEQLTAVKNFIHEYIHYLQNFSSTWGVGIFADLFIAYSKITASVITGSEKFLPPLQNKQIENELFDAGVKMRNETLKKLSMNDSFTYELKNELVDISFSINDNIISFSNGICDYTFGVRAIREHMANIGAMLTLGYSDNDIHEENLNCKPFCDEDGRLYKNPEYWIAFEYYINNYAYIKNIGKGLFFLFNECLSRLNPDKAFFRFFVFIESMSEKHLLNNEFVDFVNDWKCSAIEMKSFKFSFVETKKILEDRLVLIRKYQEHDFNRSALVLVALLLENIELTNGGRTLFSSLSDFTDLIVWSKKLVKYGSCIVSFNQEIKIFGSENYCKTKIDPFRKINSITLAFNEINKNTCSFSCPFFIDIPICKASFKNPDICDKKPFEMLKIQNEDNYCNFIAGLILLGIDKRLIIEYD